MSYDRLRVKFKTLCESRPDLTTKFSELESANGVDPKDLEYYGFLKPELKRLQKLGLAVQTRTQNIWRYGETMPNGKTVVEQNVSYRGSGSRTRWILIYG